MKLMHLLFPGYYRELEQLRVELIQAKEEVAKVKADKQEQLNKTNAYWKGKMFGMKKHK